MKCCAAGLKVRFLTVTAATVQGLSVSSTGSANFWTWASTRLAFRRISPSQAILQPLGQARRSRIGQALFRNGSSTGNGTSPMMMEGGGPHAVARAV
jgi:hypothetical protein